MAISSVSIPYRSAITNEMVPLHSSNEEGFLRYETLSSHPAMTEDPTYTERYLKLLIPDDMTTLSVQGKSFTTPARLECFWNLETDERGMAIFDTEARLIVHLLSPLLGYEGSGPRLSWAIMEHLGISKRLFLEIQSEVWQQQPYKVVLSRESHDIVDGVDRIRVGGGVMPDWEWWRVS